MQSVSQQILKAHLMGWSEKVLRSAHKDFALNPNAVNWNNLMRAMFVHQQSEFAVRSYSIDHAKLIDDLDAAQAADWGDVVSRTTTGMMLHDAVRDVAYTA